ncbi:MAG: carboxypeptidase-like regulatory domain-containing protein [Saprospiraceae bacterium]|nr:carboxypeptidase-like regulatory domain-containing protein [Saprospiraceae bacterium]
MRWQRTLTLTCLLCLLGLPASTQQFVVLNSGYPLASVLKKLEERLNIRFAYDASALSQMYLDSTWLHQDPQVTLDNLLDNQDLQCQQLTKAQYLIRVNSSDVIRSNGIHQSISGLVRDSWSGEPLQHVAVFTSDLHHGTTTDSLGKFTLELGNAGPQVIFQMLGYSDLRIDSQHFSEPVTISLLPSIQEMPEILIESTPPSIGFDSQKSSVQWHPGELLTMGLGGLQSDVLRAMQWLPGVNSGDDLNALPGVRSNQPDQNLILLNGMPLLKVDHYFGIFSALPPDLIQDVEWYRSYFPANYGGRTTSIISLNTLQPAQQKPGWHGQLNWNNLTASALVRGPVSKQIYLTLAARSTYYDLSNNGLFNFLYQAPSDDGFDYHSENVVRNTLNIRETHPSFTFNDGYIGLEGHHDRIDWRLQYFRSADHFDYISQSGFAIPNRNDRTVYRSTLSEKNDWANEAAGLYINHQFTTRTKWQNWINYTTYSNQGINGIELFRVQAPPYPPLQLSITDHFDNTSKVFEVHTEVDHQLDPAQEIQFGLHATGLWNETDIDLEALSSLSQLDHGNSLQAYGEYIWHDKGWRMESGLRSIYYTLTGKTYWEPRIYLKKELSGGHALHLAGGRYHQFLRSSYHEDRYNRSFDFFLLADDRQFPVLASWQFTGGWSWQANDWRVESEAFYHHLDGWLEHAQQMPGVNSQVPVRNSAYQLYSGSATQFGLDVLVRHETNHWPGWIAYTLSKAEQSIPEIRQGTPYPSQNDRRHQLKIVQQYQSDRWSVWAGYQYVSGKPYLNVLNIGEGTERRDINIKRAYDYLPAYQRLDVGATWQIPLKQSRLELSAGIYNVFNHENVQYRQYILTLPGITNINPKEQNYILGNDVSLLPVTPYFSVSWKF